MPPGTPRFKTTMLTTAILPRVTREPNYSAGLTHTDDTVERIGIELTRERLSWADLVLLREFTCEQTTTHIQGLILLQRSRRLTTFI